MCSNVEIRTAHEFQEVVCNFRDYLIGIEKRCVAFDKQRPDCLAQIVFIEEIKEQVFAEIDKFISDLSRLAELNDQKEYESQKEFLQQYMIPMLSRYDAPLNMQIFEKPYGYAGDFVVVNFFYEDNYPGYSTYGKLIDRYSLVLPLARAHINRRRNFRHIINKIADKRKPSDVIDIASFACGPAVEVFDVIKERSDLSRIRFTLIDGEPEVIKLLNNELKALQHKIAKENVKIIHANILNLLRIRETDIHFHNESYDLIYCAGFIDYLKDNTSARLIRYLFNLLKRDGILVIVNVAKDDDHFSYLEMIGEWNLNYRDATSLLALSDGIPMVNQRKVFFDQETKKNLYLVLRK